MKYIVTGGAGFIGSNIVKKLVARGDSVTVIDNLNTGEEENLGSVRDEINYINAHGTSTLIGDDIELNAIMRLTGGNDKIKVSSTKSSIGHLLGAAGSVEAIITILSIKHNIVPATLNLYNPSHKFKVDLVPHNSIDHKVEIALSNSFGFGGTNTALLFKSIQCNYFFILFILHCSFSILI